MMGNTYGFITGIDKYDQSQTWDKAGPARMAIEMAKWLLEQETPASQIHLFLSIASEKYTRETLSQMDSDLSVLNTKGVSVTQKTNFLTIYEFSRSLPSMSSNSEICDESQLFAYWGGHGAKHQGNRIFYCTDYTQTQSAFVFNWDYFLADLASCRFSNFKRQFLLADVCATQATVRIQGAQWDIDGMRDVDQICYFATIDNQYATAHSEEGEFSRIALECLRQKKGWPEDEDFCFSLHKKQNKPFAQLRRQSKKDGIDFDFIGPSSMHNISLDVAVAAHKALLADLPIPDKDFYQCYRQVKPSDGSLAPENATIQQILSSLKNQPTEANEVLPRPLVKFLFVIGKAHKILAKVENWCVGIGCNASMISTIKEQIGHVVTVQVFLRDERIRRQMLSAKSLIVHSNENIACVKDFKDLHANLHRLREQLYVTTKLNEPIMTESAWRDFGSLGKYVGRTFTKMREVLGRPTIDESYREELENSFCEIEGLLSRALSEVNSEFLHDCINRLWAFLDQQLPEANRSIRTAVRNLPFETLINQFEEVLPGAPKAVVEWHSTIQILWVELKRQVQEHDRWQMVDRQLRTLDDSVDELSTIIQPWFKLKESIDRVCKDQPGEQEDWQFRLNTDCERMVQAIANKDIAAIRSLLPRIGDVARLRFLEVDEKLKEDKSLRNIYTQISIALEIA